MNRKVIVILIITLLLLEGVTYLLRDERNTPTERSNCDVTESLLPYTPPRPGIGNWEGKPLDNPFAWFNPLYPRQEEKEVNLWS